MYINTNNYGLLNNYTGATMQMRATAAGRKGYHNAPMSDMAAAKRAEKQAALEKDVVHKKNTHPVVKPGDNYSGQDDMEILKKRNPGLYKEINDLNNSIINHKVGEKYGAKFAELQKRAADVLNRK